jgi:hypothetical protein
MHLYLTFDNALSPRPYESPSFTMKIHVSLILYESSHIWALFLLLGKIEVEIPMSYAINVCTCS